MVQNKKKLNKFVVYALSIIITVGILAFGFIAGKEIATRSTVMYSAFITAILFISGAFLKKNLNWLPLSVGAGMAIFIISTII